jgi:hypothetical protein
MMDTRVGELAVPEVVPRLSETPGEIRWLGEGMGAHNAEVKSLCVAVSCDKAADSMMERLGHSQI